MRESNNVTKVFEVEYVSPPELPPEDDDLEFREDLAKQRTLVSTQRYFYCCIFLNLGKKNANIF